MLLGYANGESIAALQLRLKLTRKSVGKWVDRALEVGVYSAIYDQPHGANAKMGVETFFAQMARSFLRHIRVSSWEELRERILLGIAEINAHPVIHRWKSF